MEGIWRVDYRGLVEVLGPLKAMIEIEKLNVQRKDDRIRAESGTKRKKTSTRQVLNKS